MYTPGSTVSRQRSGPPQRLFEQRSLHTTSVYLQHIAPAAAVAEATAKATNLAVQP